MDKNICTMDIDPEYQKKCLFESIEKIASDFAKKDNKLFELQEKLDALTDHMKQITTGTEAFMIMLAEKDQLERKIKEMQ